MDKSSSSSSENNIVDWDIDLEDLEKECLQEDENDPFRVDFYKENWYQQFINMLNIIDDHPICKAHLENMGPKNEEQEKKEENSYQSHSYGLYRERKGQYDEFLLAVV